MSASRISYAERDRIFGAPCNERNLTTVTTPWGMRARVHRLIATVFLDACAQAHSDVPEWKPKRCDSYACRTIRGGSHHSLHAYGLAWDFFITPPNVVPPGGVWTPDNGVPAAFARCFTERGFTWGATFTRKDVPHIEWAGGRPSSVAPAPAPAPNPEELALQIPGYFKTLVAPNGGWWHAARDGGVFAVDNGRDAAVAPFYGSAVNLIPIGAKVVDFVHHGHGYAFVVQHPDNDVTGYHFPGTA